MPKPAHTEPDDGVLPIPTEPAQLQKFARDLLARTEHLEASGSALLSKRGRHLPESIRAQLRARLDALRAARLRAGKPRDTTPETASELAATAEAFDGALDEHLGRYRKSVAREYAEAIFWAVLLTLVIRAFLFEAFKIPTGSMIPTLQIHDHLFVNKFLYGLKIPFTRIKFLALRDPLPGEVVVFEYPYEDDVDSTGKDLIKRVVAVAGDRVRLVDNVLTLNGKPVPRKVLKENADCGQDGQQLSRCRIAQECIGGFVFTTQHKVATPGHYTIDASPNWPNDVFDAMRAGEEAKRYSPPKNKDFPDFIVPAGNLLVMGDNRDNSKDGRFFGLVPLDTVKGKAGILWYATDVARIGTFVHQGEPGGTCPAL